MLSRVKAGTALIKVLSILISLMLTPVKPRSTLIKVMFTSI
jgi:hypothetical protein